MSNAVLKGNASGTGTVTLETPNTNTDRTISFPDATGTAMVSGNMPAFSVYPSTNQTSITSSTATKIVFDVEEFDTNNNFASSRFTPTVAGYYQINATLVGTGTYTRSFVSIYKNGSEYKRGNDLLIAGYALNVSSIVYCNGSTDYVEIYGWLLGTTLAFQGGAGSGCFFNGAMVRAA